MLKEVRATFAAVREQFVRNLVAKQEQPDMTTVARQKLAGEITRKGSSWDCEPIFVR